MAIEGRPGFFDFERAEDVIADYEAGASIQGIAILERMTVMGIYWILLENGVHMRGCER